MTVPASGPVFSDRERLEDMKERGSFGREREIVKVRLVEVVEARREE
mgnify:CR=1 FL=1